jgi:threonine aldolase
MLAKGFLIGLEYIALFENDLYFNIAKKQNELSEQLVNKLKEINVKFLMNTESNQNFITLKNDTIEKIKDKIYFEIWESNNLNTTIRLVTHYMLTTNDINKVVEIIKEAI